MTVKFVHKLSSMIALPNIGRTIIAINNIILLFLLCAYFFFFFYFSDINANRQETSLSWTSGRVVDVNDTNLVPGQTDALQCGFINTGELFL